jgi:hypothetical protein
MELGPVDISICGTMDDVTGTHSRNEFARRGLSCEINIGQVRRDNFLAARAKTRNNGRAQHSVSAAH